MSVNHVITVGYGFILDEKLLTLHMDRIDEDCDMYPAEYIARVLEHNWRDLDYIAAGSYLGGTPIEYAIVVKSTRHRASDLSGFLNVGRPKITAEEHTHLNEAISYLQDYTVPTKWNSAWQIGGLWS